MLSHIDLPYKPTVDVPIVVRLKRIYYGGAESHLISGAKVLPAK
jgi:hypothetical protein